MLAVAFAAASLSAVTPAAPGEHVAVMARGLDAGPGYRLALLAPRRARDGETCLRQVGPRRPSEGERLVFSGRIPRTLQCRDAEGRLLRVIRVRPGRGYALGVAVPGQAEPQVDETLSQTRQRVRITRRGRSCRRVRLAQGDGLATGIRAFGLRCRAARRLARSSRRATGRCLQRTRCRFSARSFRCRALTDDHRLLASVVRCTRGGDRVSFLRR